MTDSIARSDSKVKLAYGASSIAIPASTFYLTYFLAGQTILISSILSAIGLILILQIYVIIKINNQVALSREQSKKLESYKNEITDHTRSSEIGQNVSKNAQIGDYELYISYEKLPLDYLGKVSLIVSEIYLLVYGLTRDDKSSKKYNDIDEDRELIDFYQQLIKSHPEDILIVKHAYTGNSLTITLGPNWKLTLNEDGIEIQAPRGFIIFIVTMTLLSQSLNYGTSKYKDYLETEKIKREIELLDIQLNEKRVKNGEIENIIFDSIDKLTDLKGKDAQELELKLDEFLNETIRNDSIKQITIKPSEAKDGKNVK